VLALSADVTQPMRERCLAAGMDDFVTKPVDLSRLQATIVRTMLGREACNVGIGTSKAAMVFDASTYRELFQEEPAEGCAWLESYLNSAASLLLQISEALTDGDREVLKAKTHRLAGASLSVGATVLGALCRDLEAAALRAPRGEINRLLDLMQDASAAAREEIIRFAPASLALVSRVT
jgi:HPt (histidine-containing phosphotransfer) domain-containing protein